VLNVPRQDRRFKAPRFLDWLRARLRENRYLPGVVEGYVEWVRRFILFHGSKQPHEIQAADYRSFLEHVAGCGEYGWAEQQEARAALVFLFRALNRQKEQAPLRLLDQVHSVLRVGHYALRTEECYVQWIKRYILFHGKRHPLEMGAREVGEFLTDLAVKGRVSASTQTQALNALVFLYKHVLGVELGRLEALRANRPRRLPVVLSRGEVPGARCP
jgi:hypothetical protein